MRSQAGCTTISPPTITRTRFLPERRRAKVLVVSEGNLYLQAALLLDEYLDVTTVTPAELRAHPRGGRVEGGRRRLRPRDPAEPPRANALYLDPRGPGSPVKVGDELAQPGLRQDRPQAPDRPLPRARRREHRARAQAHAARRGDKVVGATRAGRGRSSSPGMRGGYKFVALGFDPAHERSPAPHGVAALPPRTRSTGSTTRTRATSRASARATCGASPSPGTAQSRRRRSRTPTARPSRSRSTRGARSTWESAPASTSCRCRLRPRARPRRRRPSPRTSSTQAESTIAPAKELVVDGKTAGPVQGFHVGVRREIRIYLLLDRGAPERGRVGDLPPEAHRMSDRGEEDRASARSSSRSARCSSGRTCTSSGTRGPTLAWTRHGEPYELLAPRMLGLVLLVPYFVWMLGRSLADLPLAQRVASVVLRAAFVALLALGLARLARTATTQKVCTVYLVDVSDSVPGREPRGRAGGDPEGARREARGRPRPRRHVRAPPARRPPRRRREEMPAIARHDAVAAAHSRRAKTGLGAATDIASALQLAYGLYPAGYLRRAVILSDGVQTDGDLLAEANRARRFGVKLFAVPYHRPVPGEVAVRDLRAPDRVRVGEPFELHAQIFASRAETVKVTLKQGEAINGLDGVRTVDLKAGDNDVAVQERRARRRRGDLRARRDATSPRTASPRTTATPSPSPSPVAPRSSTSRATPQRATYLASALTAQEFDVDVRGPSELPVDACASSSATTSSSSATRPPSRSRSRSRTPSSSTCATSAAASSSPAARTATGSAAGTTRRSSGSSRCGWTPRSVATSPGSRWSSSSTARAR